MRGRRGERRKEGKKDEMRGRRGERSKEAQKT